jgi:hypothetical protein
MVNWVVLCALPIWERLVDGSSTIVCLRICEHGSTGSCTAFSFT